MLILVVVLLLSFWWVLKVKHGVWAVASEDLICGKPCIFCVCVCDTCVCGLLGLHNACVCCIAGEHGWVFGRRQVGGAPDSTGPQTAPLQLPHLRCAYAPPAQVLCLSVLPVLVMSRICRPVLTSWSLRCLMHLTVRNTEVGVQCWENTVCFGQKSGTIFTQVIW